MFVHLSVFEGAGLRDLQKGQKVTHDICVERGKDIAVNLKI